jgi:hypothetical protein
MIRSRVTAAQRKALAPWLRRAAYQAETRREAQLVWVICKILYGIDINRHSIPER